MLNYYPHGSSNHKLQTTNLFLIPPSYKILYNNADITKDISAHLLQLTYTDKVAGESDELELQLEDADLLWQNAWYPQKGATLSAIIEQDGLQLNCGIFTIDEIENSGDNTNGDVVTIKALAAPITKKMRTKRSSAHENKTLREIASGIAAKHGFTVQGQIDNIVISRATQYNETDLHFLHRIAGDFGYIFNVRGGMLIFTSVYQLEGKAHILTLDKTALTQWSLKDKTTEVFKAANVKYHNPVKNEVIDADIENSDAEFAADDTIEIKTKAENKDQAIAKSKAALHKYNSHEKTGSITCPGNPLMVAGVNVELTGMGNLSGIQHLLATTHSIDRSGGYVTSAEIKAVQKIDKSKWKPKQIKQRSSSAVLTEPVKQNSASAALSAIQESF